MTFSELAVRSILTTTPRRLQCK